MVSIREIMEKIRKRVKEKALIIIEWEDIYINDLNGIEYNFSEELYSYENGRMIKIDTIFLPYYEKYGKMREKWENFKERLSKSYERIYRFYISESGEIWEN